MQVTGLRKERHVYILAPNCTECQVWTARGGSGVPGDCISVSDRYADGHSAVVTRSLCVPNDGGG